MASMSHRSEGPRREKRVILRAKFLDYNELYTRDRKIYEPAAVLFFLNVFRFSLLKDHDGVEARNQ